jgi:hypothetical protein
MNGTKPVNASREDAARYKLDRLMQELTTRLWPFMLQGVRFSVEIDDSGSVDKQPKIKVIEHIN